MRARPARRLAALIACVLMAAALPAQAQNLEVAVKATYLYKFAPFVEWPASAFETEMTPLSICIQGDDPFGPVLDRAVAGQRMGPHPVVVRRMARVERSSGCHVLYAGGSRAQSAIDALRAVHGAGVLTVTDSGHETGAHGIIQFRIKDGRVRFDIDDAAAAEDHLTISSKLLSLALSVRTRR
jgi:hypothetical protein